MSKKDNLLKTILLIGDVFLMYGTLILALAVRYRDFSFLPGPQTRDFLYHFSFIFLFWALLLYIFNFYKIPSIKRISDFSKNLLIFSILSGGLVIAYFYLRPEALIAPKTIIVLHILFFSISVYLWRSVFSYVLNIKNLKEKIIIIGFRPGLEELINNNLAGYEIIALFSFDDYSQEKLSSLSNKAKYKTISDIRRLKEIVEKEGVTTVIFPRFLHGNEEILQQVFNNLPFSLNYISFADFYEFLTGKVPIEAVSEAWFLEKVSRSEKKAEELLKRTTDILLSSIGVLITIVLLPLVSLIIKIDSRGPIFYVQKRIGRAGKSFNIYKFRTMEDKAEENGPQWSLLKDPRITKAGKVLRNLYIDEFPQFYNILKGDISFVGPRPESEKLSHLFEKEIPYYNLRHLIRPGVTGWAQIHYPASKSVKEAKEKFKYDLFYIKNRSFFLDSGIILKTIRKILS